MRVSYRWTLLPALLISCHGRPAAKAPGGTRIPGSEVDVGPLASSHAGVSLDVLVPSGGDIPTALDAAKADIRSAGIQLVDSLPEHPDRMSATIELVNLDDERWEHRIPSYVYQSIEPDEPDSVLRSVGVVRIHARGPTNPQFGLIRATSLAARATATALHGWIFDSYRATLETADTFAIEIPDPATPDVHTIARTVGVTSKQQLGHLRTFGLERIGLPELYVPSVPNEALDDAIELVAATAQTLIINGGVTRRGIIDVNISTLPPPWPDQVSGTGKFSWQARWLRGPIHDAMVIELTVPRATEKNPTALVDAIRRYAGDSDH